MQSWAGTGDASEDQLPQQGATAAAESTDAAIARVSPRAASAGREGAGSCSGGFESARGNGLVGFERGLMGCFRAGLCQRKPKLRSIGEAGAADGWAADGEFLRFSFFLFF
jgi:hypothetical protein